ncbi:MAG: TAT-variant-translocated molybdopterin oxidoreductase [Fimbriiglobus sp.]
MPPVSNTPVPATGETEYWQSVDQWMDSAQFENLVKNEFPEDAAEWLDPVSRRQFLTIMGASVALAGAVGCNPSLKPASAKKIVPFVKQPEQMLPGVPLFFATAVAQQSGVGLGVIVKQTEGRPIKIEGNPNHPTSLGGTSLTAQGTILGMYDPDRSKEILLNGVSGGYDKFVTTMKDELEKQKAKQGGGIRFLTEPTTSPTFVKLVEELTTRFPKMKWVTYEPISRENHRKAVMAAFGAPANVVYKLDKATVALSLDADFLTDGPAAVRNARDFMKNRKVRTVKASVAAGEGIELDKMNRLYAVESMLTSTGAVADHRLTLKPSQVEDFAKALAAKLGVAGVPAGKLTPAAEAWIAPVAEDLLKAKGTSVVLVGDTQPAIVHYLAFAINEKLGAFGNTVTFTDPIEPKTSDLAELKALTDDINKGDVDLLFILGGNPAYDAPVDLKFTEALVNMKGTKVRLGGSIDETTHNGQCQWHINAAHYLETWGDIKAHDGTVTIQQPLIAPLHGGKSAIEILATLLDYGVSDPMDVVQGTWKKFHDEKIKSADFTAWWEKCLRDGVVPGTAAPAKTVSAVKAAGDAMKELPPTSAKTGIEVQFRPDPTIYDGRFANNGWLQETPKPLTKLTWDNAAIVSPGTAEKLGVKNGFAWTGGEHGNTIADMVTLKLDGLQVPTIGKIAVFILPGHADDVVTLHLGYGRTRGGKLASGLSEESPGLGFNTYALRTMSNFWGGGDAKIEKVSETYTLACTQGQYLMESRKPVRHATVEQFRKDMEFAQVPPASAAEYKELRAMTPGTPEDFARLGQNHPYAHVHEHKPHDARVIPLSLYPDNPSKVNGQEANKSYRRWGMVIDLGSCIGCNTCITACVSENNIPVVGKKVVTEGRAMHWIRVDRYFSIPGDETQSDEFGKANTSASYRAEKSKLSDRIRTHFQPVLCQQCEKAPCEVVCPVGATIHSADGLNDMAYNRCVGTRYCSNNCSYKVRRFNFIQYTDYVTDSLKLVNNPEVSVRTRGVMEKCTYCVQRIRNAEMEAEREFDKRAAAKKLDQFGRPKIMDGEIVTACQAACPTGAITFGDINDRDSAVLRAKAEEHNYGLLAELNTMPRTSYLAAIRNPNPAMPKGA